MGYSQNDLFPSRYLKAADIAGGEYLDLVIKDVSVESFTNKKGQDENKPVVYFKGNAKPLILNKSNSNTLFQQLGSDTDEWFGKTIRVSSYEGESFGEPAMLLRIKVPDQRAAQDRPAPSNSANDAPITSATTNKITSEAERVFGPEFRAEMSALVAKKFGGRKWNQLTNDEGLGLYEDLLTRRSHAVSAPVVDPWADDDDSDPFADR